MPRTSNTQSYTIPITTPVKILDYNPHRIMYSIQNLDLANYIAYGSSPTVAAAGTATGNEGFHVIAGQVVSDDMDTDRIYCVANTAAVIITVTEITENPSDREYGRETRRQGSRAMI